MTAEKPPPDDRLFATRWVHVFEEDTAEGAVFRPEGAGIPLSRRPREQLDLCADGRATLFTAGPDDRLVERSVNWCDQDDGQRGPTGAEVLVLERSPQRLVVRMPG